MIPQTQSVTSTHHLLLLPSFILPTTTTSIFHVSKSSYYSSSLSRSKPFILNKSRFKFSVVASVASEATTHSDLKKNTKPTAAEVSRTIMELSSVGTLSTLSQEGYPLGVGVRFAVDPEQGTPVLCFNPSNTNLYAPLPTKSSLHVQLKQCGLRTPQCTIQGILEKPEDKITLKKLQSVWKKRFCEEVYEDLIYIVAVEWVLQTEDFMEDGVWFTSSDYRMAVPDPLRNSAENIINEINTYNIEAIQRFCNIYVDLNFQVSEAKMIWVDRFGFDVRLRSPLNEVYEVRIPFPREVTDEKGAKSSFNCMSQLAWEMEKNYHVQDFEKVKQLKKISCRGQDIGRAKLV